MLLFDLSGTIDNQRGYQLLKKLISLNIKFSVLTNSLLKDEEIYKYLPSNDAIIINPRTVYSYITSVVNIVDYAPYKISLPESKIHYPNKVDKIILTDRYHNINNNFLYPYLTKRFDYETATTLYKPHEIIYHVASAIHQLPFSHMTMIGDSYDHDILPAKSLGMKTIHIKEDVYLEVTKLLSI